MILKHFTDNDLYKFTTMYAIQKLYPRAMVKYKFFNRKNREFPEGFADRLREEVKNMESLKLTNEEAEFLKTKCYFFDPVFIDFLKGYEYNSKEVKITQNKGELSVEMEGYWFRTVLWEVPLMALISELFFKMMGDKPVDVEEKASEKGKRLAEQGVYFSEFGTRRRFSFEVQDTVVGTLVKTAHKFMNGTSNAYLAMKYGLRPIGTHPHEWFMFHASQYGYKRANVEGMKAWCDVYNGALGIALTDTYTTNNFFENFDLKHAKLFDGLRWDSGDPIEFTDKALKFYAENKIDAKSKTIVYSDSLNLELVEKIHAYTKGKIQDTYGIGTFFSNDVGANPLNIVIKLTEAKMTEKEDYTPTVKLSDVAGKNTGIPEEIELCKRTLRI